MTKKLLGIKDFMNFWLVVLLIGKWLLLDGRKWIQSFWTPWTDHQGFPNQRGILDQKSFLIQPFKFVGKHDFFGRNIFQLHLDAIDLPLLCLG